MDWRRSKLCWENVRVIRNTNHFENKNVWSSISTHRFGISHRSIQVGIRIEIHQQDQYTFHHYHTGRQSTHQYLCVVFVYDQTWKKEQNTRKKHLLEKIKYSPEISFGTSITMNDKQQTTLNTIFGFFLSLC